MFKRTFLIFIAIIFVLVAGIIGFIQSPQFAHVLKTYAVKYIPEDLGIDGDFSELEVNLIPPGVSVRKAQVTARKKNVLGVPADTQVKAERITLGFLPLQMFYGKVLVSKLTVSGGQIDLPVDSLIKPAPKVLIKKKFDLHWDELLKVKAESISLEDTRVRLTSKNEKYAGEFLAKNLQLSYWQENNLPGYELNLDLREIRGEVLQNMGLAADAEQLVGGARINASGAWLENFSLTKQNLKLAASGRVIGNVLEAEALKSELQVVATGRLEEFTTAVFGKNNPAFGDFEFTGKAKGDLLHVAQKMAFEGELKAKNLRFREWKADALQMKGAWESDLDGGKLSAEKVRIESADSLRIGGKQGASGGIIEAGPVVWRPKGRERFKIPVQLSQVHIHWAAAPVLKDIFALDFRVSGPVQVDLIPPDEGDKDGDAWTSQAAVDLHVDRFILDNQRLEMVKPQNKILDIRGFDIKGGIRVDDGGVWADGLKVQIQKTQLNVKGGVDFDEGYKIVADGDATLEEIGQIAENPIEGTGRLGVHVHGPSSSVLIDFDLDTKLSKYLGLDFGDLKGRMTWVDEKNDLKFTNMQGLQGETKYSGSGIIDLGGPGEPDRIKLDIDVAQGRIQDAIQILDQKVKDFWWFPRSISGPVSGRVSIGGGMGDHQLIIQTQLSGRNWLFSGEKFRNVTLRGGLDRGRYLIESARVEKLRGTILGRIAFDSLQETLEWGLSSESLPLSDIDWVSRLDVPLRGSLTLQSSGKGKIGNLESNTQITVDNTSVHSRGIASSRAAWKTSQGFLRGDIDLMGGQGRGKLDYAFKPGAQSTFHAEANRFDFSPALLLLNPRLMKDPAVVGRVSGVLDFRFPTDAVEKVSGGFSLTEYQLVKAESQFRLEAPVEFKLNDGSFNLNRLALKGLEDTAELTLRSVNSVLTGSITGGLDISIAEFFTPVIAQSKGVFKLNHELRGTLLKPEIRGRMVLAGGSTRLPSLESTIESLKGEILLDKGRLTLRGVEGLLSGGVARASGTIDLYTDRFPELNLQLNLGGSKIKVYPFQFANIRGGLRIKGTEIPYFVDGKVRVESALSTESMLKGNKGQALRTAKYTPPSETRDALASSPFRLGIDVEADRGVYIQNELLDAEAKGQLKIVNTLAVPRILGTAEIVQGKITFKDRVFQIQSGTAHFDNPTVINPKFELSAFTEVNRTRINLAVSGRMDKQKLEFTSSPVLPENEIITLLATGMSPDEARKIRSGESSLFDQGEAASLLLHSLDFNRDVQKKTGLQIELDEAVNSQTGTNVFRPRSDAETSSAPKIVIKRPIGKKVDISVGSTVGVGANNQQQVNAEVKVTPNFSVIGVWDSTQGGGATDTEYSYGVDLKVQKRFK